MNSTDTDTDATAVNPRHDEASKVRVMAPDPMRPHALYDPNESPYDYPGPDERGPILSRK